MHVCVCVHSRERLCVCGSRSIHPYENPDVLSMAVGYTGASYVRWMDEAVPDD